MFRHVRRVRDLYNPKTSDVLMMKYYVYVLFSLKDRKLYIGFTKDLKLRLTDHAKGLNRATRSRRPLKLVFYEYFTNETDAKAREEFLKSGYGRRQLKNFLKNTLRRLNYEHI